MAISNKKQIQIQFAHMSADAKYLLKLLEVNVWSGK
jgi:hypothetical protein